MKQNRWLRVVIERVDSLCYISPARFPIRFASSVCYRELRKAGCSPIRKFRTIEARVAIRTVTSRDRGRESSSSPRDEAIPPLTEIARLCTEVSAWKRLASNPQEGLDHVRTLERERDEARARTRQLEAVNESLVRTVNDIPCSGEAGCEALAQVPMALCAGVEWGLKYCTQPGEWPHSWKVGFPGLKAQAIVDCADTLPERARALLDRFQTLEQDNERLRGELDAMKPSEGGQSILDRLQRAEAVVAAARTQRAPDKHLLEALTAYEHK